MGGDSYVHGTSREEKERLARMNDLINAACLRELRLGSETLVLDVGCGQGQFTRLMAAALPPGSRVIGIEHDVQQLSVAAELAAGNHERVEFRQGEAATPPLGPDERGRFDLAHARFLLEHHPQPAAVVRSMVEAVRPEGRIVLLDDDHELLRFWPEAPAARAAWHAYTRLYERLGYDAFVGRRLVALLHQAGARPVRNTFVFYGACAGEAHFDGIVENLHAVLAGARDAVLGASLLDAPAYEAGLAELRAWKRRPEAAVWYAIHWAEAARPARA